MITVSGNEGIQAAVGPLFLRRIWVWNDKAVLFFAGVIR